MRRALWIIIAATVAYIFYIIVPAIWSEIANRPKLYISFHHEDTGTPQARWDVGNTGHSDAVIRYFLAWVDGTPVEGWGEFKQRLGLRSLPVSAPLLQNLDTGYRYLNPDSRIPAASNWVLFSVNAPPIALSFLKTNTHRVRFSACYCSILGSWLQETIGWDAGRCWLSANRVIEPEKSCEATPRPLFGEKENEVSF